jgi:hypothetical protein
MNDTTIQTEFKRNEPFWGALKGSGLPTASYIPTLSFLFRMGVDKLYAKFSGSGDSGDIDYIQAIGDAGLDFYIFYSDVSNEDRAHGRTFGLPAGTGVSLHELIDKIIERHVTTNWYDGDGGGGNLTINLDQNEITIEYDSYECVTEHVTGDCGQFSMTDIESAANVIT